MTTPRASRLSQVLALLVLVPLTACGAGAAPVGGAGAPDAGAPTGAGPLRDGDGGAAGACLEGATVCADVPTGTGGVTSGPDGAVGVADAVAAGVDGPFLVRGHYLDDGTGARLCEALLESLPPRCGGTSLALQPATVPSGAVTTTEGGTTFSSQPVLVEGEVVDGTFVVRTG